MSKGGLAKDMTTRGPAANASAVAAREDGQALAEYAVILALVFAVVIVAYTALGTATFGLYQQVTGALGL